MFVIDYEFRSSGGPMLIGPFDSRMEAFDWAEKQPDESSVYTVKQVTESK